MANTFEYYWYQGYLYRVEFDAKGSSISGAILRPGGSWHTINFGWEIIMDNNTPIPEEEALHLAMKKKK
jgi:hypothetical protein